MPIPYLTKSDFKACRDCRTKLYYRKNDYPTNLDDNEYLELLARGGFMIELVAKARFPGGIDLVGLRDPVASFEETRKALDGQDIVLFEAAATVGPYHVRTDILRKEGQVLHLMEIKSSSVGAEDFKTGEVFMTKGGTIKAGWKEYIRTSPSSIWCSAGHFLNSGSCLTCAWSTNVRWLARPTPSGISN